MPQATINSVRQFETEKSGPPNVSQAKLPEHARRDGDRRRARQIMSDDVVPVFTGAGLNTTLAGSPVWRPMPSMLLFAYRPL